MPIPTISTHLPQAIPPPSFPPVPTLSSAPASTSGTPVTTKKKKIPISEDLALADLEWLKSRKRKKGSEAMSSKSPSIAPVTVTSASVGEEEVTPMSQDRHQLVEHQRDATAGTASENGPNSSVDNFLSTPERPAGRAVHDVPSESITIDSSGIAAESASNAAVTGAGSQYLHSQPADLMDIDHLHLDKGSRVAAPPQMVEQDSEDVPTLNPAHPAHVEIMTGDMEMIVGDVPFPNSNIEIGDGMIAEPTRVSNTALDSAQINDQSNERTSDGDNGSGHGEITDTEHSVVSKLTCRRVGGFN
jgi:hypothetical protein